MGMHAVGKLSHVENVKSWAINVSIRIPTVRRGHVSICPNVNSGSFSGVPYL